MPKVVTITGRSRLRCHMRVLHDKPFLTNEQCARYELSNLPERFGVKATTAVSGVHLSVGDFGVMVKQIHNIVQTGKGFPIVALFSDTNVCLFHTGVEEKLDCAIRLSEDAHRSEAPSACRSTSVLQGINKDPTLQKVESISTCVKSEAHSN